MERLRHYARALKEHKHPVRFVLSRLLWRSGLSRFLTIDCGAYRIRFFPTALSTAFWEDPLVREGDSRLARSYLRAGDTVIDVGANVGTFALAAAAVVGPTGTVIAAEPHPVTFGYLERNVHLNAFPQLSVLNVAVGREKGTVGFSNRRCDDQNEVLDSGGISVNCDTLDNLLRGRAQEIALLKVDTEGFEKPVFEGARDTLDSTRAILYESWDVHFARHGYSCADVLDLLTGRGFDVYRFQDGHTLVPVSPGSGSPVCENLLAIRDPGDFLARTGFVLSE